MICTLFLVWFQLGVVLFVLGEEEVCLGILQVVAFSYYQKGVVDEEHVPGRLHIVVFGVRITKAHPHL